MKMQWGTIIVSDMNVMIVQHCMSFMKMDPGADIAILEYSHNINELPDIKEEEEQNPLLITFPVMKVEVKVSCYVRV
jgi:hypothetical protein